jgi:hypothetical protein
MKGKEAEYLQDSEMLEIDPRAEQMTVLRQVNSMDFIITCFTHKPITTIAPLYFSCTIT